MIKKIFKPFIAFFKAIYSVIDKILITPISRLVYKITEISNLFVIILLNSVKVKIKITDFRNLGGHYGLFLRTNNSVMQKKWG